MKFVKGQCVRTSEQGKTYYFDGRENVTGTVIEHNGNIVNVRTGPGRQDTCLMYDNCLEPVAPSEEEVAEAIASINQTPRRGQ